MKSANPVQAQTSVEFEFSTFSIDQDPGIDAACCGSKRVNWKKGNSIATSRANPVLWIKLPDVQDAQIIEFPQMADKIELFERHTGASSWSVSVTGDTIPVSTRSLDVAEMALKLSASGSANAQRYIRLEQPSNVSHSIDLWSEKEFTESVQLRFYIQLFLFGFCGAMIVFNLVVAIMIRTGLFAFNAGTIFSTLLIAIYMNGQGGFLIWPESPDISFIVLILGMGMLSLFATQFVSTFLENGSVKTGWLNANRYFGAGQFAIAMFVIFSGSQAVYAALLLIGLLSMMVQLSLVFISIAKGDRQSIPILIPLSILIAGICLRWARTAFSIDFGWANYHIMEIAMALEAITFSLILAARIRYFASKAALAETTLSEVRLEAANRFARLQDSERERIARDLHDSLGHSLAMINASLSKAENDEQSREEIFDRIVHSRLALGDAIAQTRRISHDLYPSQLDHLGLKKTITDMMANLSSAYDIQHDVELDFPENILSIEDRGQFYRIAQEAISNVTKHSGASHCELKMALRNDILTFRFSDNGVGIGEKADKGLGILSISQRALLIGGEAIFGHKEKGGFSIAFSVIRPMKGAAP